MEADQQHEVLCSAFPELRRGYELTSKATKAYNCVAWAAGDQTRWWWPDAMGVDFWPAQVARVETLAAFVDAFALLGYSVCDRSDFEKGYDKIALFANQGHAPTHIARQLSGEEWTSKLGTSVDLQHRLEGVVCEAYGRVTVVMRRPSR